MYLGTFESSIQQIQTAILIFTINYIFIRDFRRGWLKYIRKGGANTKRLSTTVLQNRKKILILNLVSSISKKNV